MKEQIEPPFNTFSTQITGISGEIVYWSPIGSFYPVCPDGVDEQKVKELFIKALVDWLEIIGFDANEADFKSEKVMSNIKQETFPEGIPFTSISNMPLDEAYFTDNYFVCYFTSKPYKLRNKTFITVGVIGK